MSILTYRNAINHRTLGRIRILLVILAFAGLQLLFTLYLRMNAPTVSEPIPEKMEAYNPELFTTMSFGQLPAVVDWMWIKVLEDPLVTHVKKGTHPQIYYVLDLIASLDPLFMTTYTDGATLVSVIRDDGPGALHLLLRGEEFRTHALSQYSPEFRDRYWSPQWRLPMLLAYVYLFDMDDLPHAAQAFANAAAIPGSPYYLQLLIRKLEQPGGEYIVGLNLLNFMLESHKDPDVQKKLLDRRSSLRMIYFLFLRNEQLKRFLKGRLITPENRDRLWRQFLESTGLSPTDPAGGHLSLNEKGQIVTTTHYRKVFGLDANSADMMNTGK